MKRLIALIAALLIATTAHAAPSCLPKQLGGSGRLWLQNPDTADMIFGTDPFTYPELLAIWQPDKAIIDAIRPQ